MNVVGISRGVCLTRHVCNQIRALPSAVGNLFQQPIAERLDLVEADLEAVGVRKALSDPHSRSIAAKAAWIYSGRVSNKGLSTETSTSGGTCWRIYLHFPSGILPTKVAGEEIVVLHGGAGNPECHQEHRGG